MEPEILLHIFNINGDVYIKWSLLCHLGSHNKIGARSIIKTSCLGSCRCKEIACRYREFLLSLFWALQLSRDVPSDWRFLCDKVILLGAAIKERPCSFCNNYFGQFGILTWLYTPCILGYCQVKLIWSINTCTLAVDWFASHEPEVTLRHNVAMLLRCYVVVLLFCTSHLALCGGLVLAIISYSTKLTFYLKCIYSYQPYNLNQHFAF
jgi:hypothetical protein